MPQPKPIQRDIVRAVLFDFDGTLTQPGTLDFTALRKALDCPSEEPVLEFITNLPPGPKKKALDTLNRFEMAAARQSSPNTDAEGVIEQLLRKKVPLGIISRNRQAAIGRALRNFRQIRAEDFQVVISRDHRVAPKPDPAGIRLAARRMGVPVHQTLVVGDYWFDVEAGQLAGAPTVLLTNGNRPQPGRSQPSFIIERLAKLVDIVDERTPLSNGKLPLKNLESLLGAPLLDPSVLIGPAVGEDVAAVLPGSADEVLILKSDPITFATDQLAHYAVVVNANDIATSGATPRWLLTTLLLPPGSTVLEIREIVEGLRQACLQFGISLCGGHAEITDAVSRPVVAGHIVGTTTRQQLIQKHHMSQGDLIFLTKGLAIEGTCIIARECADQLVKLGMKREEIDRCRRFLTEPGISILEEAGLAASAGGVSAMHDVTEGGIRTALGELGAAGRHRLRVRLERIPVLPETRKVCRLLQLSPWGLIGSGSLLLTCRPDASDRLIHQLGQNGITATCIGEVLETGSGIQALEHGREVAWPPFEVDEIARLYTEKARPPDPSA